jgi:hypothetical protein
MLDRDLAELYGVMVKRLTTEELYRKTRDCSHGFSNVNVRPLRTVVEAIKNQRV